MATDQEDRMSRLMRRFDELERCVAANACIFCNAGSEEAALGELDADYEEPVEPEDDASESDASDDDSDHTFDQEDSAAMHTARIPVSHTAVPRPAQPTSPAAAVPSACMQLHCSRPQITSPGDIYSHFASAAQPEPARRKSVQFRAELHDERTFDHRVPLLAPAPETVATSAAVAQSMVGGVLDAFRGVPLRRQSKVDDVDAPAPQPAAAAAPNVMGRIVERKPRVPTEMQRETALEMTGVRRSVPYAGLTQFCDAGAGGAGTEGQGRKFRAEFGACS